MPTRSWTVPAVRSDRSFAAALPHTWARAALDPQGMNRRAMPCAMPLPRLIYGSVLAWIEPISRECWLVAAASWQDLLPRIREAGRQFASDCGSVLDLCAGHGPHRGEQLTLAHAAGGTGPSPHSHPSVSRVLSPSCRRVNQS